MNKSIKTSWNFYTTNEEGWDSMLEACENAKESIDLEQFIFITNDIGNKFIDVCAKKASEGVKVRFLWDAAGSFSFFGSSIVEDLKSKNIELIFFKTLLPSIFKAHNYRSWYFRNHKRTLVVDGDIGFTGSICVSDQMIDWRDTVVRLEGSVVNEMQEEFDRMWRRALRQKTDITKTDTDNSGEFRYVTNYPLPRKHHLYKEIIKEIKSAKEYIYITTPYFIPTRHLSRVIRSAAKRGVDVKIIIPEWSDHHLVDLCSRSFFTRMFKAGVKIYLHKGEMIHNKTIMIDGNWSTVGTLNLDSVSLLYNFEANIVSTNRIFTVELIEHFGNDIRKSEVVDIEKWEKRPWFQKILEMTMRLIRDFL